MKIIFFGTPEIAVPFLEFLYEKEEVIAVVTQPDRKADRGEKHLKLSPVKLFAQKKNLSLYQPLNPEELITNHQSPITNYDLGIVVAYGKILPLSLINTAELGYLNVHFSLLPKYRGAAPVQWAIINGEKETGVSTFWLDEGIDTGKIIFQKKITIEDTDKVNTLLEKLVPLGVKTLKESIELIKENHSVGKAQVGEASYAPSLRKENGKINWTKKAKQIYNLIRGTQPWPGAFTTVASGESEVGSGKKVKSLKIFDVEVVNLTQSPNHPITQLPGTIVGLEKNIGFIVKCKSSFLLIKKVQEEGKKLVSAWEWWQGARLKIGQHLL
jgi:methionyl-tRNA formyltransferase